MDLRRWFGPIAGAAAITLLGSLTAFAVEGVTTSSPEDGGSSEEIAESDAAPLDEGEDLVIEMEVDTSSDDVEDEGEGEGEGRPEDAPDNHGQTVSEFARTTDLEGCEKGHAISAVARGADPADPQNSEQYKPCKGDDPEDVEDLDGELEDSGSEEGPGRGHGKARGNGHAKARGAGHAMHGRDAGR